MQKKTVPESEDLTNRTNTHAFLSVLYPWRKKNIGPKIIRDDKEWWCCGHHKGEDFNGLSIRHEL